MIKAYNIFESADPCTNPANPCKHQGTCTFDEDFHVTCHCTPEYEGDFCEKSKFSRASNEYI